MIRKRKLDVSVFGGGESTNDDDKHGISEENKPKFMLFTKASNDDSKLYSQLQQDTQINVVRNKMNAFKGKKYGIGAKLMAKMGYIEGEGLGANHQGILEPIETQVRKMGVGIGDGSLTYDEDEVSSDEEYYKEVPKKSLFQIIQEIEYKNVQIPDWIKTLSDNNSELANKPFIALKKENDVDLDDIRLTLNDINDKLDELLINEKMNDFEIKELENNLNNTYRDISNYNALIEILKDVEITEDNLAEYIIKLQEFKTDCDVSKIIMKILKPFILKVLQNWDPLNLDNDLILNKLTNLKSLSVPQSLEFNELSYFDSLVSEIWLNRMVKSFEDWTTDQPNLAISVLLDWSDLINEQVFEYFISNQIIPKLVHDINDWNYKKDEEIPPYVWIFDWIGVIKNNEIENQFIMKYKNILRNFNVEKDELIPGLNSFKEIYGEEKYNDFMNNEILKKFIKFFLNFEFKFDENEVDYEFKLINKLKNLFSQEIFENFTNICFWNRWLQLIYIKMKNNELKLIKFSNYIDNFFNFIKFKLNHKSNNYFKNCLDLINQFLKESNLKSIHKSYTIESAFNNIIKEKKASSFKNLISFKNVLETYCDKHAIFLKPMSNELFNNNNNKSNLYYKLSFNPTGKGKICFIEHDVLFLQKNELFHPISIDNLINEMNT